jgi:hypothetical protein
MNISPHHLRRHSPVKVLIPQMAGFAKLDPPAVRRCEAVPR